MKKLNHKDLICWAVSIIVFMPTLLVLNESNTFIPNLLSFAYIGLLALVARSNIGKMFLKRLEKIENKLFGKVGG